MLRIDLRNLFERIYRTTGQRPSMRDLSKRTGIHRSVISKLWNDPVTRISSDNLERLVLWGFYSLRGSYGEPWDTQNDNWELDDKRLMESVTSTLIAVLPVGIEEKLDEDPSAGLEIVSQAALPNERVWEAWLSTTPKTKIPHAFAMKLGKVPGTERSMHGSTVTLEYDFDEFNAKGDEDSE